MIGNKLITIQNIWTSQFFIIFGWHQTKKCLRKCTKCADRSSHAAIKYHQGLCSPFIHSMILQCPVILLVDSEGPDQTAEMPRLIWGFAVHICWKTGFCMSWTIYTKISTNHLTTRCLLKSAGSMIKLCRSI